MTADENPQRLHRFILQAIDPALGCPVLEGMRYVADLETLTPLLGEGAAEGTEVRQSYLLDPVQVRAISEQFGVGFEPDGRETWLSRAHSISEVPYLVHTGYELALMLDGVKPFAMFTSDYPAEPDDYPQLALFEPHVRSGLLIKRVVDEPLGKPVRSRGRAIEGIRQVLFARRGEEWRIDAHLLLWRQLEHGSWNETLERLQGTLLGYTDAQNDWWIAHRRQHNASATFTDRTAYAAVTDAELAWIHAAGERALPPEAAPDLIMHGMRPEPTALRDWLATADVAAIVRFGVAREFLGTRAYRQRGGVRHYTIARHDIPALNRALSSAIQVVAERGSPSLARAGQVLP